MIYLLTFLIGFLFIIYVWNNLYSEDAKGILTTLIIVASILVGMLINGLVLSIVPPTVINETETPVSTNPITNQYYLINSKGELIDTNNYEISPKINDDNAQS